MQGVGYCWSMAMISCAVRELLQQAGFVEVNSQRDLGGHERISLGRLPPLS